MYKKPRKKYYAVTVMCIITFILGSVFSLASPEVTDTGKDTVLLTAEISDGDSASGTNADVSSAVFTVGEGEDAVEYDLSDSESAQAYVDDYAGNLENDPEFKSHITAAIAKVRESVKAYATFLALLPPIIAIALALITKEVYSSLVIGIIVGGVIYAGGNFERTLTHVVLDGFVSNIADSYNVGILIFLVLLGALVAIMNKAGGSAAFGRWAQKHIKSRVGAQCATIVLGILIFIDDYFNCLTVGSVMKPVTDKYGVSKEKLSYLIDSTAAPIWNFAQFAKSTLFKTTKKFAIVASRNLV